MVDYATDIKACLATLSSGGTILYPTDTVWGIGCDATNPVAIDKVFTVKQRPKEKSLIVLLAEARDILQYVAAPPPDIIDIVESFTTPTTVIFNGALHLADNAIAENGSIAIRIPHDEFCRALIKRFGKPIISTSANFSGAPTATVFAEIDPALIDSIDYTVHYRREDNSRRPPSRIIQIKDDGSTHIIRP